MFITSLSLRKYTPIPISAIPYPFIFWYHDQNRLMSIGRAKYHISATTLSFVTFQRIYPLFYSIKKHSYLLDYSNSMCVTQCCIFISRLPYCSEFIYSYGFQPKAISHCEAFVVIIQVNINILLLHIFVPKFIASRGKISL